MFDYAHKHTTPDDVIARYAAGKCNPCIYEMARVGEVKGLSSISIIVCCFVDNAVFWLRPSLQIIVIYSRYAYNQIGWNQIQCRPLQRCNIK